MTPPAFRFGPEDYAATTVIHHGVPAVGDDAYRTVEGSFALVGVHLGDAGDDLFMQQMVAPTELICNELRDRLSAVVLVHPDDMGPPPSLAAHPRAAVFGNFDVVKPEWHDIIAAQRRVILAGWDARACVAQLLLHIAGHMPEDQPVELHFPFGPLDDAKLQGTDYSVISMASLVARYAEYITAVRGAVDTVFDGVYLGRHGEGPDRTVMHFQPSAGSFLALQAV